MVRVCTMKCTKLQSFWDCTRLDKRQLTNTSKGTRRKQIIVVVQIQHVGFVVNSGGSSGYIW